MSRENVEIFQRGVEAFCRGDLDAVMDDMDADVVFRPLGDWPEDDVIHGRDATRRGVPEV